MASHMAPGPASRCQARVPVRARPGRSCGEGELIGASGERSLASWRVGRDSVDARRIVAVDSTSGSARRRRPLPIGTGRQDLKVSRVSDDARCDPAPSPGRQVGPSGGPAETRTRTATRAQRSQHSRREGRRRARSRAGAPSPALGRSAPIDPRTPGPRALVSWVLPEPAESECAVTFQQMLKTLWNRKLTIIVSVVVCVAAGARLLQAGHAHLPVERAGPDQRAEPDRRDRLRLHPARPGPGAVELRRADRRGQGPPRTPTPPTSAAR